MMDNTKRKHFNYIDSLRGLAAIAVVFSHSIGVFGLPTKITFVDKTPLHIFWHGEGAVMVFFLISGFVLTHLLNRDENILEFKYYFRYSLLRLNRIYPAFALVIILTFIIRTYAPYQYDSLPAYTSWFNGLNNMKFTVQNLFKELSLIIPIASGYKLMPQGWTLVLEILISIVFPFLLIFIRINKIALFIFSYFSIKLLSFTSFASLFVCGIYIYTYQDLIISKINSYGRWLKFIILIIGWLLFTITFFANERIIHLIRIVFINPLLPGSVLLFILVISSKTIKRILNNKLLVYLGKISYSVYLIHFVIIFSLAGRISTLLNNRFGYNENVNIFMINSLLIIIVLMAASIFYFCIEKPMLLFGKKIISNVLKVDKSI